MTDAFGQHIDAVVADFLETALVVDDEGLIQEVTREAARESDEEPQAVRSREDLALLEPAEADLAVAQEQHPLGTKALMDAFADLGVVCSVLAPLKDDPIHARVLKAAKRADLVVLDWELHRDGGETARELIRSLLDQDSKGARRRSRVIAIYTGQPGLKTITEKIRKELGWPPSTRLADGVTLSLENARIAAFCKPVATRLPPDVAARQINEQDLPNRLANEFAQLTNGLVPGVALAALAAVRTDTHRILQALRKQLDVGYLGHRVASSFPEDAEEHLLDLVAAEIASVLRDGQVGANANANIVEYWLARARAAPEPLRCGSALTKRRTLDDDQVTKMITLGLGLDEELEQHRTASLGLKPLKAIRKQAAHIFTNEPTAARDSADVFGMRMSVRTLYRRPRRVLRLGTIILFGSEFLVCLQPRCDSIRLNPDVPRGFPFLPLQVVEAEEVPHNFVIEHPEGGGLVRLRLRTKPYCLKTFHFECDGSRSVQASYRSKRWVFKNTSGRRFVWTAELKPDFAQRVAVDLAAELARVGLSESELVRLSAGSP